LSFGTPLKDAPDINTGRAATIFTMVVLGSLDLFLAQEVCESLAYGIGVGGMGAGFGLLVVFGVCWAIGLAI
jgi:hypothetical protein